MEVIDERLNESKIIILSKWGSWFVYLYADVTFWCVGLNNNNNNSSKTEVYEKSET